MDKIKKLIAEKRRGEEAYDELIELLSEKIDQAYYANGTFADKNFGFDELWFDYDENRIFLNYSAWCGEATPDQLSFDIDEFLTEDFEKRANATIAKINLARKKRQAQEEQEERKMLAKLKRKYGE